MIHARVEIDIPCDVQDIDEFGMPYALLSEARDPGRIESGAILITADEEEPVFARVHSLTRQGDLRVVHLEVLPGDPLEHAAALERSHIHVA
jgi:hypothetical protein